eukprot:m.122258 g.122258  ORF g.122258 m.122258 type:complete len:339 (+) comp16556_c0_seq1:22-1038(+)
MPRMPWRLWPRGCCRLQGVYAPCEPLARHIKLQHHRVICKAGASTARRAHTKPAKHAVRPSPAATLMCVAGTTADEACVLMGRRSKRHRFVPEVYVFPGGRVDKSDCRANYQHTMLSPETVSAAATCCSRRQIRDLASYAAAALRETWEETGLDLRNNYNAGQDSAGNVPFGSSSLSIVGRAITNTSSPLRFDTLFFLTRLPISPSSLQPRDSDELHDLRWVPLKLFESAPARRYPRSWFDTHGQLTMAGPGKKSGLLPVIDVTDYFLRVVARSLRACDEAGGNVHSGLDLFLPKPRPLFCYRGRTGRGTTSRGIQNRSNGPVEDVVNSASIFVRQCP